MPTFYNLIIYQFNYIAVYKSYFSENFRLKH